MLFRSWVLVGSGIMIALQLMVTYAPFMNHVFHSAPISGEDWLMIIAIAVGVYALIGLEKGIRLHVFKKTRRDGRSKERRAISR